MIRWWVEQNLTAKYDYFHKKSYSSHELLTHNHEYQEHFASSRRYKTHVLNIHHLTISRILPNLTNSSLSKVFAVIISAPYVERITENHHTTESSCVSYAPEAVLVSCSAGWGKLQVLPSCEGGSSSSIWPTKLAFGGQSAASEILILIALTGQVNTLTPKFKCFTLPKFTKKSL